MLRPELLQSCCLSLLSTLSGRKLPSRSRVFGQRILVGSAYRGFVLPFRQAVAVFLVVVNLLLTSSIRLLDLSCCMTVVQLVVASAIFLSRFDTGFGSTWRRASSCCSSCTHDCLLIATPGWQLLVLRMTGRFPRRRCSLMKFWRSASRTHCRAHSPLSSAYLTRACRSSSSRWRHLFFEK